jgi:hypothetical protein
MTLEEAVRAMIEEWQKTADLLDASVRQNPYPRSATVTALTYRQCARALRDLLETRPDSDS